LFVKHGHRIIIHNSPDPAMFQRLSPGATLQYLSSVPGSVLSRGHFTPRQRQLRKQHPPPSLLPLDPFLTAIATRGIEGPWWLGPPLDCALLAALPRRPDPDGVDQLSLIPWDSFTGRSAQPGRLLAYGGSTHVYGTPLFRPEPIHHHEGSVVSRYGRDPHLPMVHKIGGRNVSVDGYGGALGEAPAPPIPPVIFNQAPPAPMEHGIYPNAPASMALSVGGASTPMHSLAHADGWVSSDSDITMSALHAPPVPAPMVVSVAGLMVVPGPIMTVPAAAVAFHPVIHSAILPSAPSAAPLQTLPAVLPGLSPAPALPLAATSQSLGVDAYKLLQLDPIKDVKSYLAMYEVVQLYLCMDMLLTGHPDGSLRTDAANTAASHVWEFQLRLAVKDGLLRFLFKNKGDLYNGRGFEGLAALDQHCCPELVLNAFGCLMSLFNDVQGENESIWEYRSCFDSFVNDLSCSKVAIPPVLMVMLFLRMLHSHYFELLD
jgi:hypothetical protein